MKFARAIVGVAVLLQGCYSCGRTQAAKVTPNASVSSVRASASTSVSVSASGSSSTVPPPADLRAAIMLGEWEDALKLLAPLPETTRAQASMRLAQVVAQNGKCAKVDAATSLSTIEHLRTELPKVMLPLLASLEVQALFCAENFHDALAHSRSSELSWPKHAYAVLKAEGLENALRYLDSVYSHETRTSVRGLITKAKLDAIVSNEPKHKARGEIEKTLFVSFPNRWASPQPAPDGLTYDDWRHRAEACAALGNIALLTESLDSLDKIKAPDRRAIHSRGRLFYDARDYKTAIVWLQKSADQNDFLKTEALFLKARAWSRSGDDERAINEYDALIKAFPDSKEANDASFLAANLRFLRGGFKEAIGRIETHLKRPEIAKSKDAQRDARRVRALSAVALNDYNRSMDALDPLISGATETETRARYMLVLATVAEHANAKTRAADIYRNIASSLPLSWIGYLATRRLQSMNEPAPWPKGITYDPPLPQGPFAILADAGLNASAPLIGLDSNTRARCDQLNSLSIAAEDFWRVPMPNTPSADSAWSFRCAYPTPFASALKPFSEHWAVPQEFVWSIYRQESAFRIHVISPAGAIGLAQMMPATAKMEADSLGIALDAENADEMELLHFQLPLSVHHLSSLAAKVPKSPGGSPEGKCGMYCLALVAAAYNAGLPAVQNWLQDAKDLSPELFFERIPYGETRAYVHRVMSSYLHYRALIGGSELPDF